jgi:hypothetical protein
MIDKYRQLKKRCKVKDSSFDAGRQKRILKTYVAYWTLTPPLRYFFMLIQKAAAR